MQGSLQSKRLLIAIESLCRLTVFLWNTDNVRKFSW